MSDISQSEAMMRAVEALEAIATAAEGIEVALVVLATRGTPGVGENADEIIDHDLNVARRAVARRRSRHDR